MTSEDERRRPQLPPPRRASHHFIVVSYDIPDDKRRTKVRKVLEDYGERVQYSVFECQIELKHFRRLQKRLRALILVKEDDLRFYHLCVSCRRRAQVWSQQRRCPVKETVIV